MVLVRTAEFIMTKLYSKPPPALPKTVYSTSVGFLTQSKRKSTTKVGSKGRQAQGWLEKSH